MLKELIDSTEGKDLKVTERMKVYEASFVFDAAKKPKYEYFLNLYSYISSRDKISIFLEDESDDTFVIKFSNDEETSYNQFFETLYADDSVKVEISIEKSIKDNYLSVYCFDAFAEDILSLNLDKCMTAFTNLFKDSPERLIFDVYGNSVAFSTKTVFFVPHGNYV